MKIKRTNRPASVRVLLTGLAFLALGSAGTAFAVDSDGVISDGEYSNQLSFADGDFLLYWGVDEEAAHFAVRARTEGWVALGIDPARVMDQSDMVFGWVTDGGTVAALDCFSTGLFGPHPPDEELGGNQDLLAFAGSESDGITTFEFSRPLDSGDRFDKPLPRDGEFKLIWAYGNSDDYQTPHSRRGGATLSLAGTQVAPPTGVGPGEDLYTLLYRVHAILMGTAFVLLLGGMFFPRYFKGKKWWLKTHRRIGIAGGVIGAVGVGMAAYMIYRTTQLHLRVLHSYVGLITILLIVATPLLGHLMLKIRKNPPKAKRTRAIHRWIGRATLVFMAAAILLGLFQAGIV